MNLNNRLLVERGIYQGEFLEIVKGVGLEVRENKIPFDLLVYFRGIKR